MTLRFYCTKSGVEFLKLCKSILPLSLTGVINEFLKHGGGFEC